MPQQDIVLINDRRMLVKVRVVAGTFPVNVAVFK